MGKLQQRLKKISVLKTLTPFLIDWLRRQGRGNLPNCQSIYPQTVLEKTCYKTLNVTHGISLRRFAICQKLGHIIAVEAPALSGLSEVPSKAAPDFAAAGHAPSGL